MLLVSQKNCLEYLDIYIACFMFLKRLQLWDLRLLLLRSIRRENVVINQVNQFSERLPIAMIRPQWSRGKTGKGRCKQARTKPLKRKCTKHRTGRGGIKEFTFSNANLGRPSDHALRKVQSGYTPFSGVFKGLLEAFQALVFNGPNPSSPVISTNVVQTVDCVMALDGTALNHAYNLMIVSKSALGSQTLLN